MKGYLALLRQIRENDPTSQVEEILGILRRFLNQPDLKEILYVELKELVEGVPDLAALVFEFLNSQFVKFAEDDKLMIDECFKDGKVIGTCLKNYCLLTCRAYSSANERHLFVVIPSQT